MLSYEQGCKGVTVYRDGSRDSQVLTAGTGKTKEAEAAATAGASGATVAPDAAGLAAVVPQEIKPRPRPEVTSGTTEKVQVGCGNLYVSVNADEYGICEVFTNTGREGGCSSQSEATSRLISIALRAGISVDAIYEQLRGIRCPACLRRTGVHVTSCPDAIGKAIKKYVERNGGTFQPGLPFSRLSVPKANQNYREPAANVSVPVSGAAADAGSCHAPEVQDRAGVEAAVTAEGFHESIAKNRCPECGHELNHESGCIICVACGYSKCG
jgi:ribonucleoside-diphosphate reductase alpha chain